MKKSSRNNVLTGIGLLFLVLCLLGVFLAYGTGNGTVTYPETPTPTPQPTYVTPTPQPTYVTPTPQPTYVTPTPTPVVSFNVVELVSVSDSSEKGLRINVPVGTQVLIYATVTSDMLTSGVLSVEVRKDMVLETDVSLLTLSKSINLRAGYTTILVGTFTPTELTDGSKFRQYFFKVSWNRKVIYDPTDPNSRESLTTYIAWKVSASKVSSNWNFYACAGDTKGYFYTITPNMQNKYATYLNAKTCASFSIPEGDMIASGGTGIWTAAIFDVNDLSYSKSYTTFRVGS